MQTLFALLVSLGCSYAPLQASDDGQLLPEYELQRGPDLALLRVPRNERLVYKVTVDIGPLTLSVGKVTISSGVDAYEDSLLEVAPDATASGSPAPAAARETAWMKIEAVGDYSLYSMDATIETRILPQAWPQFSYRYLHKGTENRRREINLGVKEGQRTSTYRSDTRRNAPRGTRIWGAYETREIPPGSVDMLSALYLSRTMIRAGLPRLEFPLVDKRYVWKLSIERGNIGLVTTGAGKFKAVSIVMKPSVYPGEVMSEKRKKKFEGLFGLKGQTLLWTEINTGIPVLIQGDLPIGPLTIGIDVRLDRHSGTPAKFQPIAIGKR